MQVLLCFEQQLLDLSFSIFLVVGLPLSFPPPTLHSLDLLCPFPYGRETGNANAYAFLFFDL